MHRFYLPANQCLGATLTLVGREAHHAAQVLRVHPGDQVIVLDGAGHELHGEVQDGSRKSVLISVHQKKFTIPPPFQITLLQAIPKGKIIESIIQKATELGVARVVPILTERVTMQLDQESATDKLDKWRLTAVEAIKQCGQTWLPKIDAPIRLKDFLAQGEKFDLPLVAGLQENSHHPRLYFKNFINEEKRKPHSVSVWVGPEGDFSPDEMTALKNAGTFPITLGRLVLRCETAAIYCLSVLNYELAED